MTDPIIVYGAEGSGSVPVEATLTLLGLAFTVVEGATWTGDPEVLARVERVNPQKQVPALVLPSGEVLTESAAILIWLADGHPRSGLSPALDDARRAAFLRWMVYVPAAIYSLYWMRDDPARLVSSPDGQADVLRLSEARIADCWRMMDAQIQPGRYLLGDQMTVLDLYVAVASRWRPGRRRFHEVAPKMAQAVRRVDVDPRLTDFWARRFPFEDGWEG